MVSAMALLVSACTDESALRIYSTPEEPGPTLAVAISELLERAELELAVDVLATPEAVVDVTRRDPRSLGIVEASVIPADVTSLALLYPSILHVLYRGEAPADFAALVRGRSVYAGPRGGSAYRLLERLVADFRIPMNELDLLDLPLEPDVFFIFGGLLSEDALNRLEGYRLFSFGSVDELGRGSFVEGVALRKPTIRPYVIPRGVYPALQSGPALTLAESTLLIANESLDESIAYRVVEQLLTHANDITRLYPLAGESLDEQIDPVLLAASLHPGARRYFERDQPTFVERYAETLALGLAVLVTLTTAMVALRNQRRQRKKDRVDGYLEQVLAVRKALAQGVDAKRRRVLRMEVVERQNDVLAQLVAEQIAGDDNLVVFMLLCNEVLKEIDTPGCS